MGAEEVAKRFRVSPAMIKKLLLQRWRPGLIEAKHRLSERKAMLLPERGEELKELVAKESDITLAEIKSRLGLACTIPASHQVLVKLGLTYIKTLHAAEQNRSDVAQKRRRWKRGQGGLDPVRLVFIDESAAKTNMMRLRGRSPKGRTAALPMPRTVTGATTMISLVHLDGTTACMIIEGTTNTEVFHAYVGEVVLPTLHPGDIVVMDNLGAHKKERILALIEQGRAEVRFLPAYSPDLNSIEMMRSKVNALLRRPAPTPIYSPPSPPRAPPSQDALGCFTPACYSFI